VREVKASHGQAPSQPSPTPPPLRSVLRVPQRATEALCDLRHGPRPLAPPGCVGVAARQRRDRRGRERPHLPPAPAGNSTGCTRAATSCCSTTWTNGTRRASSGCSGPAVSSSNATRRTASSVAPSLSSFTSRRIQHVCPRSNPHRHRCHLGRRYGRQLHRPEASRGRPGRLRQGRSELRQEDRDRELLPAGQPDSEPISTKRWSAPATRR
jgi:hypothetical protein